MERRDPGVVVGSVEVGKAENSLLRLLLVKLGQLPLPTVTFASTILVLDESSVDGGWKVGQLELDPVVGDLGGV